MRASRSMKPSMSRWSKAWSPSVRQSAPASSSNAACASLTPTPPVAFSAFTTTKSSRQSRLSAGSRSATAVRPLRPMTSPRKRSRMRQSGRMTPCSVTMASSCMSCWLSGTSGTSCAA